jgi:hypothetical protein
MLNALKIVFGIILVTMLIVTTKASLAENILKIPQVVQADPWFQATLFDAYCGFITFYCWVFYKESAVWSRILWFVLIMLLGNIAMAAYILIKLFRLPANATASSLLLNNKVSVQ